ncbi:Transposon Tf2-6 polyprotein [Labeo rohita]|uniref:Gypsy retrotransposon integrase-like protein 1 n=1 Tax=Labeo rohita TaxID=84645 RepID=A0ABQ8LQ16_LABRO|nr:Transposon Tf2-6 polyprotein [Labeo rohita]
MHSRRGYRSTRFTSPSPVTTKSEPMQIGATGLTPEERDRRVRNHLCLYCGQAGHLRTNCPIRPHRPDTARVSSDSLSDTFELEVILICNHQTTQTVALIDSGAAGNFIDISFAKSACVPLIACNDVAVTALDGRALGSGGDEGRFQGAGTASLPWLRQHNPNISWTHPQILHWSPECHAQCLQRVVRRPRAVPFRQTDLSSTTLLPSCYRDLLEAFSEEKASHLPPHRPYDCSIELQPGAMPTRGRVFPLSQPETEAMERYISEELAKGFIRPSTSPASAGFFFVKKKDGSLRPCIDYRSLNEVTIKYRYPLPLVPAALEQLRTAKYFTKLDLRSAYNLIRIKAGDEWKTAFSTTNGHYEYLVMPFGLSNSPSVFQAFVNEIFRDMLHRHLIVYIDDILIYSENLETHIQQVRTVLQCLIKHQLYAKLPKCEFHQTKITFLGYIISQDGVAMDEKKVSSVVSWPRPRTVKELQRFLGFANFYRRFIRGFSQIAAPLTSMIRGGTRTLKWTSESEQAFKELKERFTTSPILRHPDPELEFIVELSAAERNYDVGDRELLALKEALLEWRHWLEGSKVPFLVLTDHRNLEYIRSAKRLNSRQARWSLFFARFEFRITYRPGSKNSKADALSRIHDAQQQELTPDPIIPPSLLLAPVRWDIMTEIREAQVTEPPPPNCPQDHEYVPETLRTRLLHWIHDSPGAGHPGITATLELTKNRFWWPALTQDIIRFVTQCRTCNIAKSSHQRPAGLLQPLPVPHRPWSHIAIDFVTDLPLSQNYTTILTVVDRFSKACRIIPLTKLPTAWETAEVMVHQVFRVFGIPEDIVSDRGPQFTSRVWHAFCKQLNINVSLTSGYHPQSNGQVERLNQELTRFLRTYCHTNQSDWSKYVVWAEYAQNSLRKPATGLTPLKCILGYQPPLLYRISPTFHVSLLKPAGAPDGERDQDEAAETETPPLIIDGEEAYRVHEILDSRRRGRVMQYLVDWEGYGPEERSWVNAQDILDPSLIEDFHQRNPGRPAPRPRGRPRRRQGPRLGSCSQEGLCNEPRLCGSSRPSPAGTVTRVLVPTRTL